MDYRLTKYPSGGDNDWIIDFPFSGGEFPIHVHDASSNHTTTVARGSIRDPHDGAVYKCGDVIDWPAGVPHGFTALEDNTRLVNIGKRR